MDSIQSDMLICPQCLGKLQPGPEGSERLDCQTCPLSYPLRDGVPVLVIKQASARQIETSDEFERLISEALQAPFSGWDFSWLEGRRMHTGGPHGKLDYERRARERVARATAVLDLGTGGGELLSRLAPFPPITIATESYPPNAAVASRRLAPLGVKVIWTDAGCHDSRGRSRRTAGHSDASPSPMPPSTSCWSVRFPSAPGRSIVSSREGGRS